MPGLEVQNQRGEWIPVPPVPGTFVVNFGFYLEKVGIESVETTSTAWANCMKVSEWCCGRGRAGDAWCRDRHDPSRQDSCGRQATAVAALLPRGRGPQVCFSTMSVLTMVRARPSPGLSAGRASVLVL